MLLFAITSSILTALIFGLIPALRANRSAIEETLRSRSRSIAGGARRPLSGFVVSQIALALVLLSAAGVMLTEVRPLLNEPTAGAIILTLVRVALSVLWVWYLLCRPVRDAFHQSRDKGAAA